MLNGSPMISVLSTLSRFGEKPSVPTFFALSYSSSRPSLWRSTDGILWTQTDTTVSGPAAASVGGSIAIDHNGFMIDYRIDGELYGSNNMGATWSRIDNFSTQPPTMNAMPRSSARYLRHTQQFQVTVGASSLHYISGRNTPKNTPLTWTTLNASTFNGAGAMNTLVIRKAPTNPGTAAPGAVANAGNVPVGGFMYGSHSFTPASWSTNTSGPNNAWVRGAYSPSKEITLWASANTTGTGSIAYSKNASFMTPYEGVYNTPNWAARPGEFFWSEILQHFVRTDFFTGTNAGQRYIFVSPTGETWTRIDLGQNPGTVWGWCENDDVLCMMTLNGKSIVMKSLTDIKFGAGPVTNGIGCYFPPSS